MSSSPAVPPQSPPPAGGGSVGGSAVGRWSPWREAAREWRWPAGLVGGLAVAGVPVGVLWWLLAPRAHYRITGAGPVAVGNPPEELLVADDVVFVLVVAVLGLLVGVLTWLARTRRGVAVLLGVAVGMLASAAVAWQVGELLGPGPSKAALTHVGGRVTTSLSLGMLPALAVGSFAAVLVWLVAALYARTDALGRPPATTGDPAVAAAADPGLGSAGQETADPAGSARLS